MIALALVLLASADPCSAGGENEPPLRPAGLHRVAGLRVTEHSLALGWLDRPHRPRLTLYCPSCRSARWMQ